MLFELIKESLLTLKLNLLRTILTMIGIILGIAAVITIMNLGRSAYKAVENIFDSSGFGSLSIKLNYNNAESNEILDQSVIDFFKNKNIEGVAEYLPFAESEYGTASTLDEQLYTVITNYEHVFSVKNRKLLLGRWFDENENQDQAQVAVLDAYLAEKFFGSPEAALGQWLEVEFPDDYRYYQIIGIAPKPPFVDDSANMGEIFVPFSLCELTESVRDHGYKQISVRTIANANYKKIVTQLEQAIMNEYDYESMADSYLSIENTRGEMETVSKMMTIFSLGLSLIAAISLLVGGVGIMNIMLVNVTERTKEIGLMKAIGAKERDIILGFLVESVVITIFGGLIGIILGVGVSSIIIKLVNVFGGESLPTFPYTIDINAILISLLVSVTIGLLFGIMPAVRAAKLNPVDALRRD